MVQINWHEHCKSVKLVKDDGSEMILCVGDFITYDSRSDGVRIEKIIGDENPIGFEYLPWRGSRWATPVFSIRGNPRFIIMYPHGIQHHGQHIQWNSVKHELIPDLL